MLRVPLDGRIGRIGRIGRTLSLGSTSVLHGAGGILMGHDPFSQAKQVISVVDYRMSMLAV